MFVILRNMRITAMTFAGTFVAAPLLDQIWLLPMLPTPLRRIIARVEVPIQIFQADCCKIQ